VRLCAGVACLVVFTVLSGSGEAWAQPAKTITCAPGQTYENTRDAAGVGVERCVRELPGSLSVNDGPYKFWNVTEADEEGAYKDGRKIGTWKECNRFGRCKTAAYQLFSAEERRRGEKRQIPITFSGGKYVYDFHSCWATWVTFETATTYWDLNIGHTFKHCEITFIPRNPASTASRGYFCRVPDVVGVRAFDGVDLMRELPAARLPQFCEYEPQLTATAGSGRWLLMSALRGSSRAPLIVGAVAWSPDVECSAIEPGPNGTERLVVRLNSFATQIVLDEMTNDRIDLTLCDGRGALFHIEPVVADHDSVGRTVFSVALGPNATVRAQELACLQSKARLERSCSGK